MFFICLCCFINVYSFITCFDGFIEHVNNIESIEFGEPPIQFNHWCSPNEINNVCSHCLDCAYIRKYKVKNYYILIDNLDIFLYDYNTVIEKNNDLLCLLLHFNKKKVYINIINELENNILTEDYIKNILTLIKHYN